jgi:hypothetical protein
MSYICRESLRVLLASLKERRVMKSLVVKHSIVADHQKSKRPLEMLTAGLCHESTCAVQQRRFTRSARRRGRIAVAVL